MNLGSGPDQVSARRSELDELVSASQTANRPDWEATAWGFHVDRHLTLGEYDLARGAERELERVATETRDPYALLLLDEVVSRRACINGDFALAERLAGEQMSLGARLGASAGAMMIPAAGLCVPIWNLQGRLDELEQFLGLAPSTGEWEQMHALWTGSLRARQGRLDEARAAIGGCGLPIERGRSWGVGVADATTAITRLNDRALAEQLLGELQPYHHLDCVFDFLQYRGAVVHHTGRLLITCERFEDAVEDLAEAGERYERLASPPWQALARRDLAASIPRSSTSRRRRARHRPRISRPSGNRATRNGLSRKRLVSAASIGGFTGFVVAGGGTFFLGFLLEVSHRSGRRGLLVGIGFVGSGKGRFVTHSAAVPRTARESAQLAVNFFTSTPEAPGTRRARRVPPTPFPA